jgi:hypothetical protein
MTLLVNITACNYERQPYWEQLGPYYPLGTIGTLPRAYEAMEERKINIKMKKLENIIQNKMQDFKHTFFKSKINCKPACEVGSV